MQVIQVERQFSFTMDAAAVDTINLGGTTPIILDVETPGDIDTETIASTNTSQAYVAMSEEGGANFNVDFANVANGIIIYGEADNNASTYDDLIEGATVGIDVANANNKQVQLHLIMMLMLQPLQIIV